MSFSSRGCNFNAPWGNRGGIKRDINRFRTKNRFCPLIISDGVMFSFLIFSWFCPLIISDGVMFSFLIFSWFCPFIISWSDGVMFSFLIFSWFCPLIISDGVMFSFLIFSCSLVTCMHWSSGSPKFPELDMYNKKNTAFLSIKIEISSRVFFHKIHCTGEKKNIWIIPNFTEGLKLLGAKLKHFEFMGLIPGTGTYDII